MASEERVGRTRFSTPSDRELVATRELDAPRRLVWDAYTRPEQAQRWMIGPPGWTLLVCEMDLRPGGEWRFVWRGNDGAQMEMRGVFREVLPPERIVNTEAWGGDWPETLNTVELREDSGRTTMTCTILYPSREARERALATGMKDGWAMSLDRLDGLLRLWQEEERTGGPAPL